MRNQRVAFRGLPGDLRPRGDRTTQQSACRGSPNLRTSTARYACCGRQALLPALSLIPTDEGRFPDDRLASFSLDVTAGRVGLCPKMVGRESKQPEVVVVRPMAMGRTRAAITRSSEIIDRLLDILVLRRTDCKLGNGRQKIVGRPMVPCAGRCIGIVAEQDKTPSSGRRVRPLQRWREVFSVAGEAPRNCCSVGEGA